MTSRFDEILDDCMERLLQGESVEQCLARYPEQAAELEALLRVAAAATKTASSIEPRPEFKSRVRQEVQSQLRSRARKPEPRRIPALQWIPRWAVAVACVALVFVFAGGGTVAASTDTVPGDTLYPVKTATEQVQLKLTFSRSAKARLEAKFAERRVWETARLAENGRTSNLAALADRFETHLAKIEQVAAEIEATDAEDGERIAELRELLYSNMARDLVLLDAAEAKAPWRTRRAIVVAKFRLMQEYEKAIDALDDLQNHQAQDSSSGDAQSGRTDSGNPGGDVGNGDGATDSGHQGQMNGTGLLVETGSPDPPNLGSYYARSE